jgi:predicted amidohydrolase
MEKLKALLVQACLDWKDPAANRAHLEAMLESSGEEFDLAVLPETFTTGFLGDSGESEEGMDGATVEWMQKMGQRFDCAVAGSLVISEGGERFNRMVFADAGGVRATYDKRHLFSYGGEDRRYKAGTERVVFDFHGWRINLQVCYDLRFPAWCRNRDDYDLMLLVANWPRRRVHHWQLLLEARAVENQSWVIGVNRVGEDGNGIKYPGCSVVHDPMGEVVADLGDQPCVRVAELDLARVREVRKTFPFQADADRFEIFP